MQPDSRIHVYTSSEFVIDYTPPLKYVKFNTPIRICACTIMILVSAARYIWWVVVLGENWSGD